MNKVRISVVYHSGYGHTAQVATHLAACLEHRQSIIHLLNVTDATGKMNLLHQSDTILFGSPTYFGTVSAAFKQFMEATGSFWYRQAWKNKLAAGFTNSSTLGGDKLHTLQTMALFAAQHGMTWISQGVLPRFINDQQTDGQNRLGSYLGLMTHSDNKQTEVSPLHPGDLLTIELFAAHVLQKTLLYSRTEAIDV